MDKQQLNNIDLVKQFAELTLFELWRLQCAISQLLEDPNKISLIKKSLRPGMQISYFEGSENRGILATVLEIKKSRVLVSNNEDGKRWNLPFYMLNLKHIDTNITTAPILGKFKKINFKVGDHVSWTSNVTNTEMFGKIIKLNPKYARIILSDGRQWRATYELLVPVLDGNVNEISGILIEGEVL